MKKMTKKAAKRKYKSITSDGHSYLTKRVTLSKAKAAGKKAASEAMRTMGFVVIAENNVIVKKYADGTTEAIGLISSGDQSSHHLALD
jgi:hypothetical protein